MTAPAATGPAARSSDDPRALFDYNRWANDLVLDATAALSPDEFARELGGSFPSVRATLAHILASEWVWLRRWKGGSLTGVPEGWDLSDHPSIRAHWDQVEAERSDYLAALRHQDLERVIDYRNTAGEPFRNTLTEMMRHVVNHSSYHRGQVTSMLRILGARTVATDLIRYYRSRR